MTYEQRKEMFAKDYLTVNDIELLLGLDYSSACKLIREIKNKKKLCGSDPRIDTQGKVHVQDYIEHFGLPSDRYVFNESGV